MPHSKHIGTIKMMADESEKLSYSAECARKTNSTQSGKIYSAVLPAGSPWYANSVHSKLIPGGRVFLARLAMIAIACPLLTPGAPAPLISADGYRLYRL